MVLWQVFAIEAQVYKRLHRHIAKISAVCSAWLVDAIKRCSKVHNAVPKPVIWVLILNLGLYS